MSKIQVFLFDLSPKYWLSPFTNKSVFHIVLVGLFYHVLGLLLLNLGNKIANTVVPDYAPSGIPLSIASTLASGPIEEAIFFGIPYLLSSNPYVLLVIGSIWSVLHLFNASTLDLANISYGSFLFTIPHIFFSIRTWTSGKGWIAIAFHSIWNLSVLLSVCSTGAIMCSVFGKDEFFIQDILLVIISITVSILIYLSYQRKQNKIFPKVYYLIALMILIGSGIPMVLLNLQSFF